MSKDFGRNYYIHNHHCGNCGHLNILTITKGTTIDSWLKNTDCTNCGVRLSQPEYRYGGDRPAL